MTRAPRRVALLTDELELGGSQLQMLHLATGLRARSVEPSVVFFRPERADMVPRFRAAGIEPLAVAKRRAFDVPFVWRLCRALRRMRPDVVQTYGPTADLWGRLAAIAARSPALISSARGIHVSWQWRRVMRPLDRFTTAFLGNSEAVRRSLHEARGIPLDRIGVIYNGMRVPSPVPAWRPPEGTWVIGAACRLVPEKNLGCLVEAAAGLTAAGIPHRIEIAGEGPLADALAAQARALGVSTTVCFLGGRSDVGALLARWNVAVLPSTHEGLSNFVMEAMAAGVPVVASGIPSNRELVDEGRSGLLFPPDSPQALADALATLISEPARAAALAGEAARRIRRFSVEAMVEQHLALYEECLRDPSVRPALARFAPPPA